MLLQHNINIPLTNKTLFVIITNTASVISRQQATALKKNVGQEAPPEEQDRYLICRDQPMVHDRTDSTLAFQPHFNFTIPPNIVLVTLQWLNI
jgi:hypothetical protein